MKSLQPKEPVAGFSARRASAPVHNLLVNLARWSLVLVRAPRQQTPWLPASAAAAIILIIIVTVALMFFADAAASDWARRLPRGFVDTFEVITDFGLGGWLLGPLGFILVCLAAVKSPALPRLTQGVFAALAVRFGFLFIAIGASGLFVTIVKRLIGRARPYVGNHDDPFAYMPFIWRSDYASMPSGHATTAVAAAVAFGAIWPRTRWVMWLYALIIMFSRVVVLSHHPSDVLAGALVGALGAMLVRRWFARRRLVFSGADLRSYPGPSFKRIKAAFRRGVFGPWRSVQKSLEFSAD